MHMHICIFSLNVCSELLIPFRRIHTHILIVCMTCASCNNVLLYQYITRHSTSRNQMRNRCSFPIQLQFAFTRCETIIFLWLYFFFYFYSFCECDTKKYVSNGIAKQTHVVYSVCELKSNQQCQSFYRNQCTIR